MGITTELSTTKGEEAGEVKEPSYAILYTPATPSPSDDKPLPEKIIEEIGMGLYQWRVFAICGLFFFADVMEVMFLTYLKMAWKADGSVSSWWIAAIGTSVFGGMLVGATFWGVIADRYGRKKGLACVSFMISAFGLASCFSPNVQVLVVLRACVGFGLGGSHIAVTLLSEMVPPSKRSTMVNIFQCFMFLAAWTEAGLAWGILEEWKWRWMAFFTCIPSFLSVLVIYWLPESPLWLVVSKQPNKAAKILQDMAHANRSHIHIDEEKIAALTDTDTPSGIDEHKAGDVKLLFSRYLYQSTVLIWLVWWGNSMVYYGLMLITPDYLAAAGTNNVYKDIFITVLAECPALILVFILTKVAGAATAQGIFFLGSGTLTVIIATVKKVDTKLVAIIMGLMIRFFTAGSFYCTYTLTPSIYPTNVRSIGFGAGSSMSRVGGMVTPFIANLAEPGKPNGLLIPCLIYGVTALVCMLAGFLLNFTTRRKAEAGESVPLLSGGGSRKHV